MLQAPPSHYLLTASLSQEVDHRTIEEVDIDGFTLMEVAGSSAAKKLLKDYKHAGWSHGLYLCGKGNNGGDTLVVARYLLQHDIAATIVFLSGTDDLSPDAQKNWELLQQFDDQDQLQHHKSWEAFTETDLEYSFIIDGMLGTGLDSDLRGSYTSAVQWANEQSTSVFAMDIPTGLHADTGQIMGESIQADRTFAFGGHKQGFYLEVGPAQTGDVTYCELPFPNQFKSSSNTFLLDESWVPRPTLQPGQHKYASGVLYIIAGSEGLTGAAQLAARSAWAEGLGAIILICPRGLLSIYEQTLPSIIKKPVGSKSDEHFTRQHLANVLEIIGKKEGAVLIGPGLGRQEGTIQFTNEFLSQNTRDAIIDADALWALAQQKDGWRKPDNTQWILTPHPGELGRFTDQAVADDYNRLTFVRNFSSDKQITVLSKGMPGIIGTSSGPCYLTNYNTRYFARAGNGDVLAGKIAAYVALGQEPDQSCANALLQGKQKLDSYLQDSSDLPEPKDFI
ncbi:NAD(P)H-hydrate dehydratase [Fodinibius salsisoli]|uniref:Bifunctional NAD(P)H-hydrate repair enzyme n=1 Tax=Fodinibius salsisoli TaxID=2820877 RepID=A0ABT3PPW2_9BACT|nr:NAD(P)H-hydrate dehydratase [Fodinibius salsisoli]MCW9707871.1 NAD(P)H-hydrate dehydratase [Fodinibius salsisoli]